jgi:hypothetical protein
MISVCPVTGLGFSASVNSGPCSIGSSTTRRNSSGIEPHLTTSLLRATRYAGPDERAFISSRISTTPQVRGLALIAIRSPSETCRTVMSPDMRSAPSQWRADMAVDRSGENAFVMHVVNAFRVAKVVPQGPGAGSGDYVQRFRSGLESRQRLARSEESDVRSGPDKIPGPARRERLDRPLTGLRLTVQICEVAVRPGKTRGRVGSTSKSEGGSVPPSLCRSVMGSRLPPRRVW